MESFETVGVAPKGTVVDQLEQGTNDVPETREFGFEWKGGQCEQLRKIYAVNAERKCKVACSTQQKKRALRMLEDIALRV